MKRLIITTICSLVMSCASANYYNMSNYLDNLSVDMSYGRLTTVAYELVFYNEDTNNLLSKLTWEVDGAPILKTNMKYTIQDYFDVNLSAWHTTTKYNGFMEDNDWLIPEFGTTPSHTSIHEKTLLNKANEVDVSISRNLISDNFLNFSLRPAVGYKYNHYNFLARGGVIYYPGISFTIPDDIKGIGYKQTFRTPYTGLETSLGYKSFLVKLNYKYGFLISAKDYDQHYLRQTIFKTTNLNKNARFAEVDLGAKYSYSKKLNLHADAMVNAYVNARGDARVRAPDMEVDAKNCSGFHNVAIVLSSGFTYNF